VQGTAALHTSAATEGVQVKLRNPSDKLAFQIHLTLRDAATKEEILPVLWDDNYIELFPGETREINARYLPDSRLPKKLLLEMDGWNLDAATVPVSGGSHE